MTTNIAALKFILVSSICWLCFLSYADAQKVRLEGDDSRFLCLSDSIAFYFQEQLAKNHSIFIAGQYDYDNGRSEKELSFFIWEDSINIFRGCDSIELLVTEKVNTREIFKFYRDEQLAIFNWGPKAEGWTSHDFGYSICLYNADSLEYRMDIRDWVRKQTQDESSTMWFEMIDKMISAFTD